MDPEGRKIGYARVSTEDQELHLQIDALKKAGCAKIFSEKVSGSKSDRPELQDALNYLQPGDVFVVWKLDRLGRTVKNLVGFVEQLKEEGVQFCSLTDGIDTTTTAGRFFFHVMAALAEMESDLVRERTRAGLEAARARGRKGGRRPIKSDNQKVRAAKSMHQDKSLTINEICGTLEISRSTFFRYLRM
jgi:DNA invertase Pin-like site-specific DNA recombinase